MKNLKSYQNIFKYFKPYKLSIIFWTSIFVFTSCIDSLVGYLNGYAVENLVQGKLKITIFVLLIYLASEIISTFLSRLAKYYLSLVQVKISKHLSYDTFKKVLNLPAYAFEEHSSGELINRISSDNETIVGSIEQIIWVFTSLFTSTLVFIYIAFSSWLVALDIIFFMFLVALVVFYFTKKLKKVEKEARTENDKLTAMASETVHGIREVKTLGIKKNLLANLVNNIKTIYKTNRDDTYYQGIYDTILDILASLLEVSAFILAAYLVYKGEVSITFFIALTYYIYRYVGLIERLASLSKTTRKLSVALERINEILSNKLYADVSYGHKTIDNCQRIIEFKDVTFGYKNEGMVLKNFSAQFYPNQKIAIVGPSGEGKTTIFNLITRIFEPLSGAITLDGENLQDLTEEAFNQNISIIRQEPFLWNRTILENFKLLNPSVTVEEVRKYTKLAHIDDYIMSLPKGYDTLLGEGGVNLSGGQKQRLAIARTLLKKSPVILFDEATSALDNESQEYIKKLINELAKNHTVIIIAHRLSTIIDADLIYMIKKGQIIAQGKHQELLQNCPDYQKLYNTENEII